jgi:hypothetical protein
MMKVSQIILWCAPLGGILAGSLGDNFFILKHQMRKLELKFASVRDDKNWDGVTCWSEIFWSPSAAVKLLPCDHEVMGSGPENILLQKCWERLNPKWSDPSPDLRKQKLLASDCPQRNIPYVEYRNNFVFCSIYT